MGSISRRSKGVIAAILAAAVLLTGCFGSFGATRALYGWNEGVTANKFLQTAVMWGLIIVPVYGVLALGDFFVFNTIEFWTGKKLFADARIQQLDDGRVLVENGPDTFIFTPTDAGGMVVTQNGMFIGEAVLTDDGSLAYTDANGETSMFTPEQIEAIKAQ